MYKKEIDKTIKPIVDEFKNILEKDWISGVNDNSFGNVGITFERELGKSPDSTYFPDFYGVEIKCTTINSTYPLFLFSAAFDGPTFPEIDRIVEKYGNYDQVYHNKKTLVNSKWYFQFSINDNRIFLDVYDLDENLIERKSFIYIKTLYNHLMVKLQRMAIVYAMQKRVKGKKYFKYYKIDVYKLKSFSKFMYLLKNGDINASLISRISKSGIDAGRYRNKNLVFEIDKDKVYYLFDRLYYYNSNTGKEIIN